MSDLASWAETATRYAVEDLVRTVSSGDAGTCWLSRWHRGLRADHRVRADLWRPRGWRQAS